MMTLNPLPGAVWTYSAVRCGERCALYTPISYGTSNCFRIFTASCITGRSESLPIIMPTKGFIVASRVLSFQYPFYNLFLRILSSARQGTPSPEPHPAWLHGLLHSAHGPRRCRSSRLPNAYPRDAPSRQQFGLLPPDRKFLFRFRLCRDIRRPRARLSPPPPGARPAFAPPSGARRCRPTHRANHSEDETE